MNKQLGEITNVKYRQDGGLNWQIDVECKHAGTIEGQQRPTQEEARAYIIDRLIALGFDREYLQQCIRSTPGPEEQ